MRRNNLKAGRIGWILIIFFLSGCICAYLIYKAQPPVRNDVIAFNRLAKEAAENWENPERGDYRIVQKPFSIISLDGEVRYQSSEKAETKISEALANGDTILDVEAEGRICGKIIIATGITQIHKYYQEITAEVILAAFIFLTLLVGFYYAYLQKRILNPFYKLESFAAEISRGNLDFPLKIEKSNIFGAFTESFDLMREELMLSKRREVIANQNQKELIASLSHDIKTPVTSIRLTSELLLELTEDERLRTKLGIIYEKTQQIDQLVNNLFQATLTDMEKLEVLPVEIYSIKIADIIKNADYSEKAIIADIPECLILADELRLAQIISNIIYNSYKYADTDIKVESILTDTHLKITFRDYGKGAEEGDIPLLFNKFYRGKNAAGKSGSGLGLYICKKLAEQMYGEIYCENLEDGFAVTLFLKLV